MHFEKLLEHNNNSINKSSMIYEFIIFLANISFNIFIKKLKTYLIKHKKIKN